MTVVLANNCGNICKLVDVLYNNINGILIALFIKYMKEIMLSNYYQNTISKHLSSVLYQVLCRNSSFQYFAIALAALSTGPP